jgi:SAM-dependent methyltransferase
MRRLPFCDIFDAVTSFFTSFGYFHRPEEDAAVLLSVARSLRRGGGFFLDYLNPSEVMRNLLPRTEREANGLRITEERWIDNTRQRVNKRTQVLSGTALVAEFAESVRLYTAQELDAMLHAAGLRVEGCFGGYDGRAYTETSERTIFLARKA